MTEGISDEVDDARTTLSRVFAASVANISCLTGTRSGPDSCTKSAPDAAATATSVSMMSDVVLAGSRAAPYWSAMLRFSRMTFAAMSAITSAGNVSGLGTPPANEITFGSLISGASARMAEGRKLFALAERRSSND